MPFSFLPDSSRYRHRSFGFTFIEVLLILILLGILSAVAVSRINSDTDQWTNPDIFASHLRYAQSRAMAMEQPWGLQTQNGVYTMFKVEGGIVQTVDLPGGSRSAEMSGNGTWWFDGMGRPYSGAYSEGATPAAQDIKVIVSEKTLTITAVTGYVQ